MQEHDGVRAPSQRQPGVDALRGFALLGILVVNIASFASAYFGVGLPDPLGQSLFERSAVLLRALIFESKFYLLFSFLFGYSFTLQLQATQRAGTSFEPRMGRRLAMLCLLGVVHGVLLYHGDILLTYGLLGAVLLMLYRHSDRWLLRCAVALILGPALLWAVFAWLLSFVPDAADLRAAYAEADRALAAYRGTGSSIIDQHIHTMRRSAWSVLLVYMPGVLAMLLAGCVAGRHRLLADGVVHRALLRRVLFWGLAVGLPGAAFYACTALRTSGVVREVQGLSISLMTAPFLSAAYASGLMLLFTTARGGRALADLLAPAGRMALTNYLMQSLVCAWLFLAYGLRWMGSVSPSASIGIACVIFALQLVLSRWWMGRFAYGPVEWLLRAVTHRAWPRMRR